MACIQLTRPLFRLSQKFRIIRQPLGFLLRMNPLKKSYPGLLGKLSDGCLNFLDGAHRA